jgi:hypothetical protein
MRGLLRVQSSLTAQRPAAAPCCIFDLHVSLKKDVVTSEDFLHLSRREGQDGVPPERGTLMRATKLLSTMDLDQQTLYYRCFGDLYC